MAISKEKENFIMENITINDFTKRCILEEHCSIRSFIINFKGGVGDEEDFGHLSDKIDDNRIGIPTEIQSKIDAFVTEYLEPMVYEDEIVFEKSRSAGYIDENGCQHIDTEEDRIKFMAGYFEVLIETERKWMDFAMKELHPYLIQ